MDVLDDRPSRPPTAWSGRHWPWVLRHL